MARKIQSKKRYFLAFIIGTVVFLGVFFVSYALSYLEFERVTNLQQDTAYEIFENKIKYNMFSTDLCSKESFKEISESLGFQGRVIDDLERKLGKNDKRVLSRKKFYTLIELEHFDFVRTLNERCNYNINTILFFYSNERDYVDESEELGRLLDTVVNRHEELVIYSFDVNLESELMDRLKDKYDIKQPLTLVVNGEKIENPKNIKEIESLLKESPVFYV